MSGPRKRTFDYQRVGHNPPMVAQPMERKYTMLRSRWSILINTNMSFQNQAQFDRVIEVMDRATADLTNERNELERANIVQAYHFNPPTSTGSYSKTRPTQLLPNHPDPYFHAKARAAFETSLGSNYLHEHIDLTLDHIYGPGAVALKLNSRNLRAYFMERLVREANWDPGRQLFIRIKRMRANMARSYLSKQIEQSEQEARMFEDREALDAGIPQTIITRMHEMD